MEYSAAETNQFYRRARLNLRDRSANIDYAIERGVYGPNVVSLRRRSVTFDMYRVGTFDNTVAVQREARLLMHAHEKKQKDRERRNAF